MAYPMGEQPRQNQGGEETTETERLEAWMQGWPSQFYDGYSFRILSNMETALAVIVYAVRKAGKHRLAKKLEGGSLVMAPTRLVGETLRQRYRDLSYRWKPKRKGSNEIRIDIEATSGSDQLVTVRSTDYSVQGALQEAASQKRVSRRAPGFTMVINFGPRGLRVSCVFEEMFSDYDELEGLGPRNITVQLDLMAMTLEEILAAFDCRTACVLGILRIANRPREFRKADIFRVIKLAAGDWEREQMVALCIACRFKGVYYRWALQALDEAGIGRDNVEGMMEIREREAKAEGVADVLLRQVREKFKDISDRREAQVRSATLEQLEEWAVRLLHARDIDALFAGSGRARSQPQG